MAKKAAKAKETKSTKKSAEEKPVEETSSEAPAASEEQAPQASGEEAKAPANMPLFYASPVPLDSTKHNNLGLKSDFDLSFTAKVNAVPVNIIEMPQVCHYYPIAFSPDGNSTPVALLGLRDNENLFLDDKGNWKANTYIPAYIRRYPFIFSEIPGTDQLTLCIDMNMDIIEETDGDKSFFDKDNKPTELSQNALEFCKSYHAAAQQTLEFSKALSESGLLVDRQAEIKVGSDKKISFSGFRIIDEQKLNDIPDEKFVEWRQKGWLPFLYAHLFSGAQWQNLTRLLNEKIEKGG